MVLVEAAVFSREKNAFRCTPTSPRAMHWAVARTCRPINHPAGGLRALAVVKCSEKKETRSMLFGKHGTWYIGSLRRCAYTCTGFRNVRIRLYAAPDCIRSTLGAWIFLRPLVLQSPVNSAPCARLPARHCVHLERVDVLDVSVGATSRLPPLLRRRNLGHGSFCVCAYHLRGRALLTRRQPSMLREKCFSPVTGERRCLPLARNCELAGLCVLAVPLLRLFHLCRERREELRERVVVEGSPSVRTDRPSERASTSVAALAVRRVLGRRIPHDVR
ncbi:hypothetical protein MRX96_010074 [Rhipicephalus microplus]